MAFDSKTVGADPGEAFALAREFGRTYVPVGAEPPVFTLLDSRRASALEGLALALIPGDAHWPSAADAGAAAYADNVAARSPVLREALTRLADVLVAESDAHDPSPGPDGGGSASIARAVQEREPGLFEFALELIFEGYYRDRRVQEIVEQRTGYLPAVPVTGIRMTPFDESRLDGMRERPARVREVDA